MLLIRITLPHLPIMFLLSFQDYQATLNETSSYPLPDQYRNKNVVQSTIKGAHNFVPGVMALVLMLVCVMMTAFQL